MGEGDASPTTKRCPFCAEEIQERAIVCKHCGRDLTPVSTHAVPASQAPPLPPVFVQTPAPRTNGLAIASLVLGIVWIYGIGAILALVFGYMAKSQIDQSGGREGGRGLAIAGIVLGWVGLAGIVLAILVLAIASTTTYGWT